MHGKTSAVEHHGDGALAGLRHRSRDALHSLAVFESTGGDDLPLAASTASGTIMGPPRRVLPLHSVQFHAESVLTVGGRRLFGRTACRYGATTTPSRALTACTPIVSASPRLACPSVGSTRHGVI